jgi:hypothetical protein
MTRFALVLAFAFSSVAALGACGSPQVVAADHGQPAMQAALVALQGAQTELNAAMADKGGHREKALASVQEAIDAVNAGAQYAAAHADEVGEAEGPAETQPVDEEVAGAANQPHMGQAIVDLREARKQLRDAKHDKGGFRKRALASVQQAIDEVKAGIAFANGN